MCNGHVSICSVAFCFQTRIANVKNHKSSCEISKSRIAMHVLHGADFSNDFISDSINI